MSSLPLNHLPLPFSFFPLPTYPFFRSLPKLKKKKLNLVVVTALLRICFISLKRFNEIKSCLFLLAAEKTIVLTDQSKYKVFASVKEIASTKPATKEAEKN